jgi:hypothetical protein
MVFHRRMQELEEETVVLKRELQSATHTNPGEILSRSILMNPLGLLGHAFQDNCVEREH